MEKTVRDHVLGALNKLESENLKSFRNKLGDPYRTVKEGYNNIPQGKLENKDREDLTKLILQYYGDEYGVELTVSILKAINENQVAADLEQRLVNGSGRSNIGGVLLAGSPGENRGERKPMQPPQIVKGFTWGKKPNEEPPSTSEVKVGKRKKPNEEPPSTSGASSSSAPEPQETHFVNTQEDMKAMLGGFRSGLVSNINRLY